MPENLELWVGRDSAHVRELLKTAKHTKVISAADFFESISALAFFNDDMLRQSNEAALLLAADWLSESKTHPPYFAKDYVRLFNAFFHGMCPPTLVLSRIEEPYLKKVLSGLSFMEEKLGEQNRCTAPWALFKALLAMGDGQTLPFFLQNISKVRFCYLVDLTTLEINCIKMLAALGMSIDIVLPMDFQRRGLNAVVDFIAKQFEKEADETNITLLFDDLSEIGGQKTLIDHLFLPHPFTLSWNECSLEEHPNVISSAHRIAQQILSIKHAHPKASIALVTRTKDSRLAIYKQTLESAFIPFNDAKGHSLLNTEAGRFFTLMCRLRRDFLKKSDILAYFCHPFKDLRQTVPSLEKLLDELKVPIANNFNESATLYQEHIDHFVKHHPKLLEEAFILKKAIQDLFGALSTIQDVDTFTGYTNVFWNIFNGHKESRKSADLMLMLDTLAKFLAVNHDAQAQLSFLHYGTMLSDYCQQIYQHSNAVLDAYAVQILTLPEVLGKRFDHIFVIDMNFGRMPKTIKEDGILDDKTRLSINKLFQKPILRVFLQDPFEPMPVPARQALEPFFFASAIAEARQKVWFSRPQTGEDGKDEMPSDFFAWLKDHLTIDTTGQAFHLPFTHPRHARFFEGMRALHDPSSNALDRVAIGRQRLAYKDNQQADDYSFRISATTMKEAFNGSLDGNDGKIITPTFIENFSECRFKGLLDRVIFGKSQDKDEDIDIRLLGSIAHKCLELYFKKKVGSLEHSYDEVLKKVSLLVDTVISEEAKKAFIPNIWLVHCHGIWLKSVLTKLIFQMHESLSFAEEKSYTELSFGLSTFSKNPAVSVRHGDKIYRLGGIIDHLILTGDQALILDYKLSSTASLKQKIRPSTFLQSHFQAPIYLRLVVDTYARNNPRSVQFMLLSIRDAEVLSPIKLDDNDGLLARIVDDNHEESMAKRIDEILTPISQGTLNAIEGAACDECHHRFICRKDDVS